MATRRKMKEPSKRISPFGLAFLLNVFFAGFVLLPAFNSNPRLMWSVLGAAGVLFGFLFLLHRRVASNGRALKYEFVARPVHYVQLTMHTCIFIYWGWYWREVYHQVPLIVAQIVFTYVLDMLVCWSRRDTWILGFGPFPIVLSTNLFLWFKPDWFFLQFAMLATGVLCKEFVTWTREGRRMHIFNPSGIALFLFSLGLILTHSTPLTWGEEIAVSFQRPPHIYVEIFLLGLVVQALFSVTLVTLSAAATLYALNLAFTHSTGLYYFIDTNIPAAVFLGLHLLVTDPATSPRRSFGKIVFGSMYGAGVFGLYWLLGWLGAPTFYDKLLCVPPLNLTVRTLDRASDALAAWIRFPAWTPRRLNFGYMGVWVCLFAAMMATGFLSGSTLGADPEFWHRACLQGRGKACETWIRKMDILCSHGSASACLTSGAALNAGQMLPRDQAGAGKDFAHACELGVKNGCGALLGVVREDNGKSFQDACGRGDGESCFLLGSLYYAGQGVPRDPAQAFGLLQQSCERGWSRGCAGLAECYRAGAGTAVDNVKAIEEFDRACRDGVASSCFSASSMYRSLSETAKAEDRLRQGCQISLNFAQSSAAYFQDGTSGGAALPPVCSEIAQ